MGTLPLLRVQHRRGRPHAFGNLTRCAKSATWNAAGNRFAERDHVGFKTVVAAISSSAAGYSVGLVYDEQDAGFLGRRTECFVKTRLRRDHAEIGHHRLS